MIDNSGNIHYIHVDHLNTPQVVTDQNQQVVWKGDYSPFGEVEESVATIEFNLRFPGQYYDAETGLNYNYFRSYDASTGRYTQGDPIGLEGGLNRYHYAWANPIYYLDKFGGKPTCSYWSGHCRENPNLTPSGGAGGGGTWLVVGTHASSGLITGGGKTCAYSLLCIKIGLGISGYLGVEIGVGATNEELRSGTYNMKGGFLEGGLGVFGGVSVFVTGEAGASVSPARLSSGAGLAAGYIECTLTLLCDDCGN